MAFPVHKLYHHITLQEVINIVREFESEKKAKEQKLFRVNSLPIVGCCISDSSDVNFGKSEDIESSSDRTISEKKSHLDSLKEWGRARLRLIRSVEPAVVKLRERAGSIGRRKWDKEETPYSSSGNWSASSESGHSTSTSHIPRSSISSGSMCPKHGRRPTMVSTSSSVTSESTVTADDGETCSMYSCDTEGYYTSFHLDSGLKTLREEEPVSAMHSSSALSGSRCNDSPMTGDSEYELFGKGSTSTTASSAGTVCTTLLIPPTPPNVPERKNSQLSSMKLPERNVQSLNNLTMTGKSSDKSERETQSLKMDRKISELSQFIGNDSDKPSQLTKANVSKLKDIDRDYLKEKGIITVDVHHHNEHLVSEIEGSPEKCGDSPDSGHNTCSSPVDSITSPSVDMEMSECSDLEGLDRIDRINRKTVINSSRIPSMCVITPPQSDDEVSLKQGLKPAVDAGDYVTIAEVKQPASFPPVLIKETEYVSLNELNTDAVDSAAEKKRRGARVTLDSEGKVVYSSESLRRRKQIHTTNTFEPGPNVLPNNSPLPHHRAVIANVKPLCPKGSPLPLRIKQALVGSNKVEPSNNLDRSLKASDNSFKSSVDCRKLNGASPSNGNIAAPKIVSTFSNGGSVTRPHGVKSNTPLILTCSTTTNRGMNVLPGKKIVTQANGKKIVSPNSPNQRPLSPLVSSDPSVQKNVVITSTASPHQQSLNRRDSTNSSRSNSPCVISNSPSSPKPVSKTPPSDQSISPINFKGAYVRMQEPSDCLETCLDDPKAAVKRSDSYRLANDKNANEELTVFNPASLGRRPRGITATAGPNLLVSIRASHSNQKDCERPSNVSSSSVENCQITETGTWPRRSKIQSTSTPTKENYNQLEFSSNISPIQSPQNQRPAPGNQMPKSYSTDFQQSLNARDRFYNNYLGSLAEMYNSVNYNHIKHKMNAELMRANGGQAVPAASRPGPNRQTVNPSPSLSKNVAQPPFQSRVNQTGQPSLSSNATKRFPLATANQVDRTNHPSRSESPMLIRSRTASPLNAPQNQISSAGNFPQNRPASPMSRQPNRPASPMNMYASRGKQIPLNGAVVPVGVQQRRLASPVSFQPIRAVSPVQQNARLPDQRRALSPSSLYETRSQSPTTYPTHSMNNQPARALSPSSQYPNHSITPNQNTFAPPFIRTERDGISTKINNFRQNVLSDGRKPSYPPETFSSVRSKNNILTEKMNAMEANSRKDDAYKKTELVPRPRSVTPTRTGMDLYAVIHESKKRIKALQNGTSFEEPCPSNHSSQNNLTKSSSFNSSLSKSGEDCSKEQVITAPKIMSTTRSHSVNDFKPVIEKFRPSSQTSRYDFKKLLLKTGWGSSNRLSEKVSAVERLKNKTSPEKQAKESKFSVVDRLRERTPTPRKKQPWKSNVLSSTIPEDCAEDEEPSKKLNGSEAKESTDQTSEKRLSLYLEKELSIPKSSALVNQQLKAFSQNSSPNMSPNESPSRRSPSDKSLNRSLSRSPSNRTVSLETSL
ncbi:uncharacterized protein gukh isoform X2 [Bemisia tabaci]|uniref:uncharacterized protein gukh isoform X2 n=1 Tax=Bemisia tabaci TaxID=7038 RepID=UPI003B2854E4